MGIVEQGASGSGEVQATPRALEQTAYFASLALGGDGVHLGVVASQAANAARPAGRYPVGQRHIFGGECFGDLKEIHGFPNS